MAVSEYRNSVLKRIREYEKEGLFDKDVEADPPTVPLKEGEVDFTYTKPLTKIKSEFANLVAKTYFDNLIRKGKLIIKEVNGIENYRSVRDKGVIITSNHFHAYEQYAVYKSIEKELGKNRLYKIIREGNYTTMKGIYGFFFRNCNTLPIGSKLTVFREFSHGIQTLLDRGEKILIYPEQAMWWNYRKPRPLKSGAFQFAAKSGAPVLPFFITMEDTKETDSDGLFIQAYTVNILKPIFPDRRLSVKENSKRMAEENYRMWCETYEKAYKKPVSYTEVD